MKRDREEHQKQHDKGPNPREAWILGRNRYRRRPAIRRHARHEKARAAPHRSTVAPTEQPADNLGRCGGDTAEGGASVDNARAPTERRLP
jgi:hypothetical protein